MPPDLGDARDEGWRARRRAVAMRASAADQGEEAGVSDARGGERARETAR